MRRLSLVLALAAAGLAAGAALAAGPSPGISNDAVGISAPGGAVRYVALARRNATLVRKLAADGKTIAERSIPGKFGIPRITWDGQTGGLSRDGRTLVLSTFPGLVATSTGLLVLDTRRLAVERRIALSGIWSFDALSPDARTIYLIQYLDLDSYIHYRVRAYDLAAGKLVKGAIVDKTEPGPMEGQPLTRVTSADGTWAYTLYSRANGRKPFVHALDTVHRFAVCIDLAYRGSDQELPTMRLELSADGSRLVLRRSDGTVALTVAAPR